SQNGENTLVVDARIGGLSDPRGDPGGEKLSISVIAARGSGPAAVVLLDTPSGIPSTNTVRVGITDTSPERSVAGFPEITNCRGGRWDERAEAEAIIRARYPIGLVNGVQLVLCQVVGNVGRGETPEGDAVPSERDVGQSGTTVVDLG